MTVGAGDQRLMITIDQYGDLVRDAWWVFIPDAGVVNCIEVVFEDGPSDTDVPIISGEDNGHDDESNDQTEIARLKRIARQSTESLRGMREGGKSRRPWIRCS
jgi:hypothetical protein